MAFPFLKLPAELRNRIYDLVAGTEGGLVCITRRPNGLYPDGSQADPSTWAALTRVCRQIRTEYMKIYRQEAHVSIYWEHLGAWLDLAPVEYAPAKKVSIKIAHGDLSGKKVEILPILRLNARFFADRIFETIHIDLPKAFRYHGMSADSRLDRLLKRGDEPWLSIMRGDNSHWRTLSSVLMNHDQRILEMVFESDASSNKPVPGDEDIGKRAPGNRGWDIFIWRAAL